MDGRRIDLWPELARREDLPVEAQSALVQAVSSRDDADGMESTRRWRDLAMDACLPVLFNRPDVTDDVRAEALRVCPDRMSAARLIAGGQARPTDVTTAARAFGVGPELVAAAACGSPEALAEALRLLPQVTGDELDRVVAHWRDFASEPSGAPPMALMRALLDRILQTQPHRPAEETGRVSVEQARWSYELYLGVDHYAPWNIVGKLPTLWPEYVEHPRFGPLMGRLLLDHTEELPDELLHACVPALPVPELAAARVPRAAAEVRLHTLTRRIRRHPTLRTLAADQIRTAVAEIIAQGRLLSIPRGDNGVFRALAVVGELVDISDDPTVLGKAVALLARLHEPTETQVVHQPGEWSTLIHGLTDLRQRRATHLHSLAARPETPQGEVRKTLACLHPAELRWLHRHTEDGPGWFRREVSGEHARRGKDDLDGPEVLHLPTDDELDGEPDPGAILARLVPLLKTAEWSARGKIARTILDSRHTDLPLLLTLPADDVLTSERHAATIADAVVATCGAEPARWTNLAARLTPRIPTDATLGDILADIAEQPAVTPPTSNGDTVGTAS